MADIMADHNDKDKVLGTVFPHGDKIERIVR
jgi:hypothetical protein